MKVGVLITGALGFLLLQGHGFAAESASDFVLEGYELESARNFAGAEAAYSKSIELNPEQPAALIRRAYCRVQIGDFQGAGEDLKQASITSPQNVTDYLSLAWMRATAPFEVVRDGILAITYAKKAHKEQPSPTSYDTLAAAYAEFGDYNRARHLIMEALKKFPDSDREADMRKRLELYKAKKPFHAVWLDEDSRDLERSIEKAQ